MPNGGSDCCGTCWFNSNNEGKPGYHGSKNPGKVRCIIRDIEVPVPFYTYCVNHPHHNKSKIEVPLGPVYVYEYPNRVKWLDPPKNEEITLKLLEQLDSITNEVQFHYPSPIDLEITVIQQLKEMKEERAIPGLLKIIGMNIDIYQDYDWNDIHHAGIRNKASIVGAAIEALLYITDGTYLDQVEKFVDKGLESYDPKNYNQERDNFAVIRYHLFSGLKYCPPEKCKELLEKANNDPHESIRNLTKKK